MNLGRRIGIRTKLIGLFVLIKVLPLVALAWVAWVGIDGLGDAVEKMVASLITETRTVIGEVGDLSTDNSIRALDLKSREAIERLSTDTARSVAAFLHDRDRDIRRAASLEPSEANYRKFLAPMMRPVTRHKPWVLNEARDAWVPDDRLEDSGPVTVAHNKDNAKDFHSRPPDADGIREAIPLYLEMTFVGLDGRERLKVTTSDILSPDKADISDPANTYCRAERYYDSLQRLGRDGIYVSEVIGPHVPSPVIGPYTPKAAEERGIPFRPEEAAYAGKENPVGKRFQGLIRWAAPVVRDGRLQGWVTLALDHTHVMEFTDHIVPTDERYTPISDAYTGNYAFMWDYKDRNISHPRDYFIVGYDPETGEPAVPWLEDRLYEDFRQSGLSMSEWQKTAPVMRDQALARKPSKELTRAGNLGLDCRYLNFAPQCEGWHNLTQSGGSGSFVILWSGLWKLTTAAAIPYYTGMYGDTPRGFGFVTIGANVHEFHKAATETGEKIKGIATEFETNLERQKEAAQEHLQTSLGKTSRDLALSTFIMIVLVILIAVWIASTLTRKITGMISGIREFQEGRMDRRLSVGSQDEMGQLAQAFNDMSDDIQDLVVGLRKAEEQYRGLFENATEGIFRTTVDGRFIHANPALARLFGYDSPEDMMREVGDIGRQLYRRPEDREELLRRLRAEGHVRDFEFTVRRPDGTERHLLSSAKLAEGEDGESYIEGIITDITERRLKEKAEIEREAAQASNIAKSNFLATMSHEIRTPMNAVLGMTDMLAESNLDLEQRQYVDLFRSAGESLLKVINEILDFSKIEAGLMSLEREPMDLHALIDDIGSIMQVHAENHGIGFHSEVGADVPRWIMGDSLRLRQVLMNLAENAVKFTRVGQVTVSVAATAASGATDATGTETASSVSSQGPSDIPSALISFRVEDTGIGIDKHKLGAIFDSFTQADSSTTRQYGGTGLGLSISRHLVGLMGGRLEVDSTLGVGTVFQFSLPVTLAADIAEPEPAMEERARTDPTRPARVLVVEDVQSNQTLIDLYLKGTGHETVMCDNGAEGLATYKRDQQFDLILMDMQMPVMDGMETTRAIRDFEAAQGLPQVPIAALTANAYEDDRRRCLDTGCTYYLAKPVKKAELLDLIASCL